MIAPFTDYKEPTTDLDVATAIKVLVTERYWLAALICFVNYAILYM